MGRKKSFSSKKARGYHTDKAIKKLTVDTLKNFNNKADKRRKNDR